jgi:hypothetical protein
VIQSVGEPDADRAGHDEDRVASLRI